MLPCFWLVYVSCRCATENAGEKKPVRRPVFFDQALNYLAEAAGAEAAGAEAAGAEAAGAEAAGAEAAASVGAGVAAGVGVASGVGVGAGVAAGVGSAVAEAEPSVPLFWPHATRARDSRDTINRDFFMGFP